MSLFTSDAQFFCLSEAQNAQPAGGQPAGGAFCAADKRKNRASNVKFDASFQKWLSGVIKGLIGEPCCRVLQAKVSITLRPWGQKTLADQWSSVMFDLQIPASIIKKIEMRYKRYRVESYTRDHIIWTFIQTKCSKHGRQRTSRKHVKKTLAR